MSILNKLLALLTCLVIVCGLMVSCGGNTPSDGENDGNSNVSDVIGGDNQDELSSDKYVATVKTVYATTDRKMKDAIDAIGTPITTISVDGDKIKIASDVEVDDMYSSTEYVCVDDTLYYSTTVGVGDLFASDYKKAPVGESGKIQLLNNIGAGASIGADDFADVETVTSGKLSTYTCTGINEDAKAGLHTIFASKFALLNATVEITSVSYYLETIDDRIDNSVLSCDFVITMDGQTYSLTAHIYYTYDYDALVEISAPADTSIYKETTLDDII